jgi:hypothetical protein
MAMTWENLKSYVNSTSDQDAFVEQCWDEAGTLINKYIRERDVPNDVYDRARIEVGQELFNRRSAPNGIAQFATFEGTTTQRVARDPMIGAYPLLNPIIGGYNFA